MSERSQTIMVWWALVWMALWGFVLWVLMDMVPPPTPKLSANEIAQWYANGHDRIRIGAVIDGWISGFILPFAAVLVVQVARQETGRKVWTVLTAFGGALMTMFLCLPPIMFGVAAYTVDRSPDVTAIMHELGMMTLVTSDQYYIFMFIGVAVMCLIPTRVTHSPFPRWFGYYTIWSMLAIEVGALAFLPRSGPFAWHGLLAFWMAAGLFFLWMILQSYLLLTALKGQREEAEHSLLSAGATRGGQA